MWKALKSTRTISTDGKIESYKTLLLKARQFDCIKTCALANNGKSSSLFPPSAMHIFLHLHCAFISFPPVSSKFQKEDNVSYIKMACSYGVLCGHQYILVKNKDYQQTTQLSIH